MTLGEFMDQLLDMRAAVERGEFGVEGDVKSAFAQFEQHLRAFELAVRAAEEAQRG